MFRIKNLSKDFITKIIDQAAGKISQNRLEDFFTALEKELANHYYTNSSESNLLRIIQHQFDIAFFINECLKYPPHIEILINISNNSNYLSDILVRNPEYFFWIINPSTINQVIDKKYYSKLLSDSLSTFKSFEAKTNILRNFKRKEILRIGLKDIYLKDNLRSITNYLSILAVSISKNLFNLCYNEILIKHKIEKVRNRYVLFSLGKLGGSELNYSSDIDLIAFYDKNTLVGRKIYYNQILAETILLFIETASIKTGSGFLYRVDFRLRPDGRNAPLCGSYEEYLRYYEARGEDWERQMLIKANFLCGSKSLFNKFYNYVTKFVFPTSFLIPPTEQIKKLKSSVEKRDNIEGNIKLISGGIRDIEFSLQALQLINGGKDNYIRTGNSLEAIKKLQGKSILTKEESVILRNSYIFYRQIEHYLQLMNDQQTHTIPEDGEIAEKVAHFLNSDDLEAFKLRLNNSKSSVLTIFNSIMESTKSDTKNDVINDINFSDRNRAFNNLEFLRTGKSLLDKKQFDARVTNSFERLEEQLFNFLTKSIDPDLVLENFARVIKYASLPKIWYDEFSDDKFFDLFLQLCEHSQKSIDLFAEDKILRDDFLSRDCLVPLDRIDFAKISLKSFLFRASVQLVSKNLLTQLFSELYNEFIRLNFERIIEDFCIDKNWKSHFFIAGMGSFGSAQMSFSSDVDLIFAMKDINNFPNVQKDFQNLLKTLRDNFQGLEIDCRLRPEGRSSLLVWDINNYKKYFTLRARIWELQAFTKCKLIYGNFNLFDGFIEHYIKTVEGKEKDQIKIEIINMRKKLLPINKDIFNIKKSFGGLVDIDFMITYLFLIKPLFILKLKDKKILDNLNLFKSNNGNKNNFHSLIENFRFLKTIELMNQNIFNTKTAKIPSDEKKLLKLSNVLGFDNRTSFLLKLNDTINQIRKEYQYIFN